MAGDKDSKRDEVESEVDVARKNLELEIEKRQREAKEKLDEILSEKNLKFCERCGKHVGSREDWGGKCLWEGCESLICRDCWDVSKFKFCKKHAKNIVDEGEEKPRKREVFREEEEEPEIKVDLKAMLDEHEESRMEKIRYYASEYARFLRKRMEKAGPIDWTPERYMKKPRFEYEKKEDDHVISVSEKRWLFRKTRLSVVVKPYDARVEEDVNALGAELHKAARKYKGYVLLVLVTEGASMEVGNFVNRFSDSSFCLFLAEPKKAHLNFNIKGPVASGYSEWFSQKKEPGNFKEKLRALGDLVSGRKVVSEKDVVKEFGFREKDARHILDSCDFLERVKDTDTYMLKE
jgi:hypothetical protein